MLALEQCLAALEQLVCALALLVVVGLVRPPGLHSRMVPLRAEPCHRPNGPQAERATGRTGRGRNGPRAERATGRCPAAKTVSTGALGGLEGPDRRLRARSRAIIAEFHARGSRPSPRPMGLASPRSRLALRTVAEWRSARPIGADAAVCGKEPCAAERPRTLSLAVRRQVDGLEPG